MMGAATKDSLSIPMWERPTSKLHGPKSDKADLQIPMWIKAPCDGSIEDYVNVVPQHQSQAVYRLTAQRITSAKLASLDEPADASSDESTVAEEPRSFLDACEGASDVMSDVEWGAVSNDCCIVARVSSDVESVVDGCDNAHGGETNAVVSGVELRDDVSDVKSARPCLTTTEAREETCTSATEIVCGTSTTQSLVAGLRRARLQAVARRMELTRRQRPAQ